MTTRATLSVEGEITYHLEFGSVTVHFFEEEWEEFLELVGQLRTQ